MSATGQNTGKSSLSRNRFSQKKHAGRQAVSFDSFTSSASTSASASENSSIDLGISLPASKKSATSFKVLSRSLTGTYFGKGIGPKPSTAPAGYENISMTQQRTKTYVPRVGVASSMKMNRSPVRAQSLANHYHNQSQEEPSISELNSNVPKRSKSASVDYGRHTMNSSSYKVLEFLHCGPVETTLDISWLCSNKIAILVNLSDVEMAKNRIECYCENTLFHSPKEIAMKLDCLDYPQNIVKKFHDINNIIAGARSKGTQVLLLDNDGFSCQLISIQYIMQYFFISLNSAIAHLERSTKLRLPDNCIQALRLWEKNVFEQSAPEINLHETSKKRNEKEKADKQQRKIAWS